MASKADYERHKAQRRYAKAIAGLSTAPDELNVMINYCDEILRQQMLFISVETRADLVNLIQRRDDLFDSVDRQLGGESTSTAFRCKQMHILMNTLFGEVLNKTAKKDFVVVSELAVYLIGKTNSPETIAAARGFIVTVAPNYMDIETCLDDDDCVAGWSKISRKFVDQGGWQVTLPA